MIRKLNFIAIVCGVALAAFLSNRFRVENTGTSRKQSGGQGQIGNVLSPRAAQSTPTVRSTPAPRAPLRRSGRQTYKVERVVDGDTVVLLMDGQPTKVRLIGVDTPETVHPKKAVEYYGKEASRFLKNLLGGEEVWVEYASENATKDKYGRVLAYLYRAPDGLFVNAEIIRQGYGHAYTRFPFKYMEEFRSYERAAREAQRGLWAEPEKPVVESSPNNRKNRLAR